MPIQSDAVWAELVWDSIFANVEKSANMKLSTGGVDGWFVEAAGANACLATK
jgi:hypothetical protein